MLKKILNPKVLLLLLLILGGYFVWQQPEVIPYPSVSTAINQIKQSENPTQVLGASISAPDTLTKAQEAISSMIKTTKLPTSITGLPEEVVVEDLMISVTSELKKLPEKEAQKLKVQFCQDVLEAQEGSGAANVSPE